MAVKLQELDDGKVLEVSVSGMLRQQDYPQFVPAFERYVHDHDKVRVLFDMDDFHGWDMNSMWDEVKFDAENFRHIDRLAMVGEQRWQQWMATFCKPFVEARIRYFDHDDKSKAVEWLEQGGPDDPDATQKLRKVQFPGQSQSQSMPAEKSDTSKNTTTNDSPPGVPKPPTETPIMGV